MQKKSYKKIAIIGHTGFIGFNLKSFYKSKYNFNTKNLRSINNKHKYDLVILCAPSSKMWIANKFPQKDYSNIKKIINVLKKVKTKKIVLISTIEVYGKKNNKSELNNVNKYSNTHYGMNRIYLEEFIKNFFSDSLIIRLPIVYGKNFTKNCIYDLQNKNNLNLLNGNDLIQLYNVKNLKKDIDFCLKNKIKLINISSKPIRLKFIAKNFFDIKLRLFKTPRVMMMKTSFFKKKKYFYSQRKTINDLRYFIKKK
jgi:nucleoside-diphosphate-sugar epimerase